MADDAAQAARNEVVDGRRARRERGRRAVIDAMIDLVLDGGVPPSAEQVASCAGVSQASLFRYFSTLDELRREAIGRYFDRFADLIGVPEIGEGSREERIRRLVDARHAFYDRTAPMARLARRQLAEVDDFAETLERVRSTFADQVAQHFAPELAELAAAPRRRRVAALAALTSFEAWDQLATLGPQRTRAMTESVDALLPG